MNPLEKYYDIEEDLNTKFEGSYQLLKYIISRYNLYGAQVTKFATTNNYSISSCKTWSKKDSVPNRAWNIVHKDLIMLRLSGKIEDDQVKSLEELEIEFEDIVI